MASQPADITGLLAAAGAGDRAAAEQLAPLVYAELRKLAAAQMRRERPDHTLQTTALVHEAYLRLVAQRQQTFENRAHFFGIAAHLMRQVLVDHARARLAAKRGGGAVHLDLDHAPTLAAVPEPFLLDLDQALTRLAELSARQAQIVEMRYFVGLSEAEIARALDISERTVKRDWSVARAWLHQQMSG